MKTFMGKNFLLDTETAKTLYHDHAAHMPIIDYHNHLSAKEIYEDIQYSDLSQVWLGGDHYKWRALRANGVPEEGITGAASPYEKFENWAKTVPALFGNPLYHWTHLELQRYFDICEPLSPATMDDIWNQCNAKLAEKEYSTRSLLKKMNVEALCTTDDPKDDLYYHKALKHSFPIKVLPTFRPEQAMSIEKPGFPAYIRSLGESAGYEITSIEELMDALLARMDYFAEAGCRISDHSLDSHLYAPASKKEADAILKKGLAGQAVSSRELSQYKGYLLTRLGREYHRKNWVMQLHVGALRNNASRLYEQLGPDTGFDSMDDFSFAPQLSALLNEMDRTGQLPKTILYCLNPKDNDMLASMAGNFQGPEAKSKVQFGAAWWFCDHLTGMEQQLESLSHTGVLANFVGMLTDSRSFLSFPRHEYFRRILCRFIGQRVENGEYPPDMDYLGQMVERICYYNAKDYFSL